MYYGDLKVSDLVAYVRPEQDSRLTCGTAYGHVVVSIGYLENGQARGLSYSGGYHDVEPFASLEIRNQVSSDQREAVSGGCSYGWQVTYRDVFSVDLERAENMTKVLRKVQRGLAKEIDASGYAATFGQYVARVLKVLGITKVIMLKPREWPSGEDVTHRAHKPGQVVSQIDQITREMAESLAKLAA